MREQRFWSQEELATRAGLNRATVYKAEGGAGVSPRTGRALAKALDVDPAELVEEAVESPKAQAPPSHREPSLNDVIAEEERRITAMVLAGCQEYLNHLLDRTEELRNKFAFDVLGIYSPEEKVVQVRLVFKETHDFLHATKGLSTLERNLFGSLAEDAALSAGERERLRALRQTIVELRHRGQALDQHVEKIRSRAHDLRWLQEQVDALDHELAGLTS